jgi:hypothetical protein
LNSPPQLILARTGNRVDALLQSAIGLEYCKPACGMSTLT